MLRQTWRTSVKLTSSLLTKNMSQQVIAAISDLICHKLTVPVVGAHNDVSIYTNTSKSL